MNNLLKIGDIKVFGSHKLVGAVFGFNNAKKSYKVVGLNGCIYAVPFDVSPIKSVKLSSEVREKLHTLALTKARIFECERELETLRDKASDLNTMLYTLYKIERGL